MAEIGIIASIIGVAGAGFRLSIVLHAVSCEVANAGLEVNAISRGVSLFALMLKHVGNVLQENDSVHSQEAVEAAKKVSDECKLVFHEIELLVDKARGRRADGSVAVAQRFKWAFRKSRIQYLLGQLESLKLNLSLMLQILQLGKLMAATSKNDTQEEVQSKMNAIQQERFETQNIVIVRYWQIHDVEVLKEEAKKEAEADKQAELEQKGQNLLTNGTPQLAIEAPREHDNSIIKVPGQGTLSELDQILRRSHQSPRDMMQVSSEAIDPLLDHWTRWHEVRERRHARNSGGSSRFTPSVQPLNEDDDDRPLHQIYRDREESPQGLYLEGNTTDWRKPHSVAAKTDAAKLRKRYSGYQASVSADSSEVEDSPGSRGSKKASARTHVISSGSSGSSDERPRGSPVTNRRRSSGSPTTEKKNRFDGPPLAHSYSAGQPMGNRKSPGTTPYHTSPRASISHQYQPPTQPPHRPIATPTQNPFQHSISSPSPLPPINTSNAPNPYSQNPGNTWSPNQPLPPYVNPNASLGSSRYMQSTRGMTLPPRPGSQDGKARSPSRLSHHSSRSHGKTEEEKKAARQQTTKAMREGATRGILGAGALAGFLEVLEGL